MSDIEPPVYDPMRDAAKCPGCGLKTASDATQICCGPRTFTWSDTELRWSQTDGPVVEHDQRAAEVETEKDPEDELSVTIASYKIELDGYYVMVEKWLGGWGLGNRELHPEIESRVRRQKDLTRPDPDRATFPEIKQATGRAEALVRASAEAKKVTVERTRVLDEIAEPLKIEDSAPGIRWREQTGTFYKSWLGTQ